MSIIYKKSSKIQKKVILQVKYYYVQYRTLNAYWQLWKEDHGNKIQDQNWLNLLDNSGLDFSTPCLIISYAADHMQHIICGMSYVAYHMRHVICGMSYAAYHMRHMICETGYYCGTKPCSIYFIHVSHFVFGHNQRLRNEQKCAS